MSTGSDRPAPRFGPRVRTYEQQITAEFEQEIADLNLKLCERDMEIERLRADKERIDWLEKAVPSGQFRLTLNAMPSIRAWDGTIRALIDAARAASRDEERDHE